jgi:hypothetical protein
MAIFEVMTYILLDESCFWENFPKTMCWMIAILPHIRAGRRARLITAILAITVVIIYSIKWNLFLKNIVYKSLDIVMPLFKYRYGSPILVALNFMKIPTVAFRSPTTSPFLLKITVKCIRNDRKK